MARAKAWDSSRDPDGPRIIEEAAAHFLRTVNRRASSADHRALQDWLARDVRHAAAYSDVERLWKGASDLPEARIRAAANKKKITRRTLGKTALLLAAGGAAAWSVGSHPFADYKTGTGERKSFTAPDGSRIELAPHSKLSLAFNQNERGFTLHDGEAFFAVVPDPRPFLVHAGEGTTRALGTAFAIDYRDEDARLRVTEHAVQLSLRGQSQRVSAGSQVHYARGTIGTLEPFDADIELRWRRGQLVFLHEPLSKVVRTLNLWRRGQIIVPDSALAARPITLIVDVGRSERIVDQLSDTLPIRVLDITPFLTVLLPQK